MNFDKTYIATAFFFLTTVGFSCGQARSNVGNVTVDTIVNDHPLRDTTIKFLWRENKYDEALKDTFNSIFINEDYCKTISDEERAALGYVATFIGNECWWEEEPKDDRSNLKCVILTALNLGYQCSDKHLGFLRQWFRNDPTVIEELKSCPTTPFTSTIQDTFDEIKLTIKGNEISVWFSANGMNTREGKSWNWTETDYFKVDNNNLTLLKTDKSKVKQGHFKMGE